MTKPSSLSVSLLRRLGAILYDAFLVIALLMLAGGLVFAFRGGDAPPTGLSWYTAYLVGVVAIFFVGFWTRGGQTLGMRAWQIKLVGKNGNPVSIRAALVRLVVAAISAGFGGLGFLWQLIDSRSLAWHDHLSDTHLVRMAKTTEKVS